jgi:hypothetical protein
MTHIDPRKEPDMKHTRATCGIVLMAITLLATMAQAADLELITPALSGLRLTCLVTNVSDGPVNIRIEVLDGQANFSFGGAAEDLPPLWTSGVSSTVPPGRGAHKCRLTSDDGKKGDLRVTFCTVAADGACQAAVTAE